MSTRATYEFQTGEGRKIGTIYIHHDGYPEGAADYFYDALVHNKQAGGLICQMIRANERAEITRSHEYHGDTEYRYTVKGDGPAATVHVEKYTGQVQGSARWNLAWIGPLHDFVEKHINKEQRNGTPWYPFKQVAANGYNMQWLNEWTAAPVLADHLRTLAIWKENGHNTGANWSSKTDAVQQLVGAFPTLRQEFPEVGNYLFPRPEK